MPNDAPSPTTTDEPAAFVCVEDLHKRYGGAPREAVAGISFEVREGELFGLLGPNGAGKTTTIGAITTRVKPTGGRVLVGGKDAARDPVGVKQQIAMVPQRPNLDRVMTPFENLVFHAAYFGMARRARRELAMTLLEQFGLADRAHDQVNYFSGGMGQRLMIARALMHEPRLLILDEPTTGLDPQARLFLWEQMLALRERGTTLILTTHDMAEADRLCDRIAVVDTGKIIALDTPRGLRGLLPAENGVELEMAGEPGRTDVEVQRDMESLPGIAGASASTLGEDGRWRVRLYPSDPSADGDGLLVTTIDGARGAGYEVRSGRMIEGTLEDVFIHLTGRELR